MNLQRGCDSGSCCSGHLVLPGTAAAQAGLWRSADLHCPGASESLKNTRNSKQFRVFLWDSTGSRVTKNLSRGGISHSRVSFPVHHAIMLTVLEKELTYDRR